MMHRPFPRPFHFALVVAIILLGLGVRLAYLHAMGGDMVFTPDSSGYYTATPFFDEKFVYHFFDMYRTPGYGIITDFVQNITNHAHPTYLSVQFLEGTHLLLYAQIFFGVMSLLLLFDTLLSVGISPLLSFAFTAFTAGNIYQYMWERAFLTESLYIFLIAVLFAIFVKMLHKPTALLGVLFCIASIYGFLLRPAGIAIPYLLLPIVWLLHRSKKTLLLCLSVLLIYSAIPTLYVSMNYALYGYRGMSANSDFSVFGRILLHDLPITPASSVTPDLYAKVMEYKEDGGNVSLPWYFFQAYDNVVYGRVAELQHFNQSVIRANPLAFGASVLRDIPNAFFDTEMYEVHNLDAMDDTPKHIFSLVSHFYAFFQYTTILFLLLFPIMALVSIRSPSTLHAFLFGIGLVQIYQLFSSLIFGGAWEFARHVITTQTYLFFFCFWWYGKIMGHFLRKK